MKTMYPIYCFRTEVAEDVKVALEAFYRTQEMMRVERYTVERECATVIVRKFE